MTRPRSPHGLGALLRGSLRLVLSGAGEVAVVVALGLLPDALLRAWTLGATGLGDPETLRRTLSGGHLGRYAPAAAARAAGEASAFVASLTLLLVLDARDRGAPLGLRRAFAATLERLWPYFATMTRVFLLVAGGLLLFVAPGVFLAYVFALAGAAVVVDGLSGRHALSQSRRLVEGRPGRAAGYLSAAASAAVAAGGGAIWLLAQVARLGGPPGLARWQLVGYAQRCAAGLALAWLAAFTLLLYKDLEAVEAPDQ